MLNRITLVGRLTKDPELRKTGDDKTIINFDLAVDNPMKDTSGERGTCFLTCKVFGNLAEVLASISPRKGEKLAVDGSIQQRNFERKDGTRGHDYEVIVDSIEFCSLRPQEVSEVQKAEQPEAEIAEEPQQEPMFDPYTGKPLKKVAKNSKK